MPTVKELIIVESVWEELIHDLRKRGDGKRESGEEEMASARVVRFYLEKLGEVSYPNMYAMTTLIPTV